MIKSFKEGLIVVNNCDVADFVDLMKTLYSVFDEFSEVYNRLNCI